MYTYPSDNDVQYGLVTKYSSAELTRNSAIREIGSQPFRTYACNARSSSVIMNYYLEDIFQKIILKKATL